MELVAVPDPEPEDERRQPRHLSPSSAGTFEQCPKRWEYRYIHRLPDPPGEAALAGTFAHLVLEHLLQREPAERTIDNAKTLARELWPEMEADPDFVELALEDDAARQFRWRAWLAIEGLWHVEDPQRVQVHATEQDVETELGGVPFRGIVDRIDVIDGGHFVVTDYKSGRAPSARFRGDKLGQVLLYAAAVQATTGKLPVTARLIYLGQREVATVVTQERVDDVVAGLGETWSSLWAAHDADAFETRTGPLCGWCPYADRCEAGQAEIRRRIDLDLLRADAPGRAVVAS